MERVTDAPAEQHAFRGDRKGIMFIQYGDTKYSMIENSSLKGIASNTDQGISTERLAPEQNHRRFASRLEKPEEGAYRGLCRP